MKEKYGGTDYLRRGANNPENLIDMSVWSFTKKEKEECKKNIDLHMYEGLRIEKVGTPISVRARNKKEALEMMENGEGELGDPETLQGLGIKNVKRVMS